MKLQINLLLMLSSIFIAPTFAGCQQNSSSNEVSQLVENGKKVIIHIEGMSCMSCVANIKKNLLNIDGVIEVKVSLQDRNTIVTYNPEKVTTKQLKSCINKLGYKAGKIKELKA